MDPLHSRAEAAFHEALLCSSTEARDAYLDEISRESDSLAAAVRRLLKAHEKADSKFFNATPGQLAGLAADAAAALNPELAAQFASLKPEEPGDRIGPYKLLQQIGEGGFGVVWMAEQTAPVRRKVALKIIKVGMDTREVISRFEQERHALGLMDHPNIAKVLDAGATATGRPFFVMELVSGVTITEYFDKHHVAMKERLKLFIEVCHAVQHAHQKGLIHRDLKPSNVLVSIHDGVPVPKVIDFGVAKATQAKLTDLTVFTHYEQMIGTPIYMSPEQAEMSSLDIDTRSDIYSLGVLLYEILTGRTPFNCEELMRRGLDEVRRVIREEDPPTPSTALSAMTKESLTTIARGRRTEIARLISTLKGDLDWIVMRALEKDRTRRYETANELAMDIQRHLNDQPVLARPPSTLYRFRRMVRRNKLAVGAAGAVAASLVLGAAVSMWQALRVTAERDAKQDALQQARAAEADTAAFGDFLVNRVLAAARPEDVEGGLGIEVTIARALEQAEKQLGQDFAGRPLAEALARDAIGVTWETLGRYEDAKWQLRRAIELRQRELGPDDPATLKSMNDLAVIYTKANEPDKAVPLFEEVLRKRKVRLAPDHPHMLISINNLAGAYYETGDFQKALPLYDQAYELSKATLGPDDRNTLKTMSNLARAWRAVGNLPKALPLYKQALEKSRSTLSPDHPDTLTRMNNLAVALEEAGDLPQALDLYKEAYEKSIAKLDRNHPDTLASMDNLAGAYDRRGDFQKAIELYEQALAIRRIKPGEGHRDTLTNISNLAVSRDKAGEPLKALPLYQEAYEKSGAMFGWDSAETLKRTSNLAIAYSATGDPKKALPLFQHTLEKRQSVLGPDKPETLKSMNNLAFVYLELKEYEKSLEQFKALLAARRRIDEKDPQIAGLESQIEMIEKQARESTLIGNNGSHGPGQTQK